MPLLHKIDIHNRRSVNACIYVDEDLITRTKLFINTIYEWLCLSIARRKEGSKIILIQCSKGNRTEDRCRKELELTLFELDKRITWDLKRTKKRLNKPSLQITQPHPKVLCGTSIILSNECWSYILTLIIQNLHIKQINLAALTPEGCPSSGISIHC
jgi:hypothetical protein